MIALVLKAGGVETGLAWTYAVNEIGDDHDMIGFPSHSSAKNIGLTGGTH